MNRSQAKLNISQASVVTEAEVKTRQSSFLKLLISYLGRT